MTRSSLRVDRAPAIEAGDRLAVSETGAATPDATSTIGDTAITATGPGVDANEDFGNSSAEGHVGVGCPVAAGGTVSTVRVAIVTESFLPQVNGVTNSVIRVLDHLRRHGHQTMVIAPGAGPAEHEGTPVVRVPALDLPVVNSLPIGVPTRKLFAALREFQPHVVHLASPFVVGAGGAYAARRLGVPSVAVFQTDVAGFASSYGLGLTAKAAWRWTRRLHAMADRTLAPSSWAVEALRQHGVPRVRKWARGVDIARFAPSQRDDELRAELAPNGELLVGYVGRLAPEKYVERLTALHDMPGVKLVIVGDGPSAGKMRELLPNAAFLGFRTGDPLATAYASLDLFVHTGPYETFCQTVQEALASGIPVLAPDAGGPRDLVQPGRTGFLLPPYDADAHAVAAREAVNALRDPELRAQYGSAARKSVLGRTWPAVCDELLDHYWEVTGRPMAQRHAA